jgi:hypothetical protein
MSTASITAAIKVRVQAVLGASYSELGYATDVSKNTFKGNDKRFAVLSKGGSEQSGIIGYITYEQDFEVILTDGFINRPLSDSQAQDKAITLQDLVFDIYKDLVKTKCGSNTCITVRELSLSDPQYLEKDNVVAQTATFKVKFRQQL